MCGICGIVDHSGRPIEPPVVDHMRDAMANRGPDDAGTTILPYAGLGHRRLSIVDLSPRGRQPMTNEDGSVWLVFDGEIYEFEPLRRDLEDAGHVFRSDSDSEMLVHGFEEWGIEGLVERLNGKFAFGLWDAARRELHLVRDRLGEKPLYYGWHHDRFAFASELKALWTLAPGQWKVRVESIARFLYWTYVPGRETVYEDLYQLRPAHILTLTANGHRERRYWRLSFANKVKASLHDVLDETDAVLTAAVRRRLRSDVPIGAFLSGGVDSSYVVSRMAACGPVRTFSMGTRDQAYDELSYARRVAELCGAVHTEFEVIPDAWSILPRLVWEFGQPSGDTACIPTYYLAERASQQVTVALTGDGGDESFAGDSQHLGRHLGSMVKRGMPAFAVERLLHATSDLIDGGDLTPRESAARFLRYVHPDPLVNWGGASHWALHHLPRLWSPHHRELADRSVLLGYAFEVDDEFDGRSALDRALHHDLGMLLPFCYNVKVDVATMMSSLEARCAFQDVNVVEWAARIPAGLKVRRWEKKALLKQLVARRLPRDLIYRTKQGFSIPVDEWLRGPCSSAVHRMIFSDEARGRGYFDYDYLEQLWAAHAARTASHGTRFWALLWLEVWLRMFVERTMTSADELPAEEAMTA
jgi:asparagine synthase (glutamine-hydrolysing)